MSGTQLQCRSSYTLMHSTLTPGDIAEQAKALGYSAAALTDDRVMYGAVSFYQACVQANIKPIIGLTLYIESNEFKYPLILLALNNNGYQTLLSLSTRQQLDEKAYLKEEDIEDIDDVLGILPVTETEWARSIVEGEEEGLAATVEAWKNRLGTEQFYLGVQDHGEESEQRAAHALRQFVENYQVNVTAVQDIRYKNKPDALAYTCLKAMREGDIWAEERVPAELQNHHYPAPEEMQDAYAKWWPEVLEAADHIASRCHVNLSFDSHLLPSYPLDEEMTADTYLRQLCQDQLHRLFDEPSSEAIDRMEYELNIITSMQFSDYFLIVWDFVAYAKREGIKVGPGRGSAAGSFVAFLLGITEVDPLEYDLLFERFLNPERMTMPDIDIDFPDHRRDEMIQYVAEKYGRDKVAQIITFGTFAARSLLRELFKVMDVQQSEAAFILKHIPANSGLSLGEAVRKSSELVSYIQQSPKLKKLFKVAAGLEGLPRHVSTHAAGVVISEVPLVRNVPLTSGHEDVALTQYAMEDLESIGLLKMDFLGLRNLSLMERIEHQVNRTQKQRFSVKDIPFDDALTYELLKEGKTNGIFQLESSGMKGVLQRLRPSHFEDVVAVNALYRPGPMEYISVYINRKHGLERVQYPHPDVAPLLEKTFGVLVYQEQIMQVAEKIAGFTLGQADILRRAVSKKKDAELKEQRTAFIEGCVARGYDRAVATEIFEWIVKFSNYGFNRSHAVAYSIISYQLAYLKAHYPSFFLAELMNAHTGHHDKLANYIREAKGLGVEVLHPSINSSVPYFRVDQGRIRMGLIAVKGVGYQAAKDIVEARSNGPFKSLHDFCLRVPSRTVSRQVIEALILAGALDETRKNRATLLASIDQAMEQGELFKEFDGQTSWFESGLELEAEYIEQEAFPTLKNLAMEKEVLGTYLSDHPLGIHREQLRQQGYISLKQAEQSALTGQIHICAVVDEIKEIRTKRGDPMAFIKLSDEAHQMEGVLFPDIHRKVKPWLTEQMMVTFKGKLEKRNHKLQWLIAELQPYQETVKSEPPAAKRVFVRIHQQDQQEARQALQQIASYFPGNTPVIVFNAETRKTYQLDASFNLELTNDCLRALYDYFGKASVAIKPVSTEA
ncbi:DNA polymerase III subunit alpha [Thalassobacillus sp. CUG 92003]|uniref:DNA polymerase III subunit alpha n=1 Tax=Thalassobacillus sp. CUG 92003 TaxID=2736641 RepID=UPI0015E79340|nr:DNA polymerase III subunit alpha [Thalassobacillus sp. CUG 92003]